MYNLIKLTSIIILILFVVSCKDNSSDTESIDSLSIPPNIEKIENKGYLKHINEVTINLPTNVHNYKSIVTPEILNDSLLYYVYERNKIAKINLNSERVDSIIIPPFILKANIVSIYPITEDSLLVVNDYPASVFIINQNDSVIYYADLPKVEFVTTNVKYNLTNKYIPIMDYNFNLTRFRNCYVDKNKMHLHIGIKPIDYFLVEGMEPAHTIGVFDINNKVWDRTYGKARGLIKSSGELTYGHMMSENYFIVKGDTTIISYPISHSIYVVNNINDSLLSKHYASSSYSTKISPPITTDILLNDYQRLSNWRIQCPFYDRVVYYPSKRIYSRLYLSTQELYDNNGLLNHRYRNRKLIMLLFDENFNLISDSIVSNNDIEAYAYVSTSKGLLVVKPDKQELIETSVPELLNFTDYYEVFTNY